MWTCNSTVSACLGTSLLGTTKSILFSGIQQCSMKITIMVKTFSTGSLHYLCEVS